jgi:uncharacterized protein (DUF1778 family)
MAHTTKSRRIEIRVSERERALEEAAAQATGESLSEFVRRAAHSEAQRILEERTRFLVDDDGARRFLEALERPVGNEAGLRRLVEHPSVLRVE